MDGTGTREYGDRRPHVVPNHARAFGYRLSPHPSRSFAGVSAVRGSDGPSIKPMPLCLSMIPPPPTRKQVPLKASRRWGLKYFFWNST